MPNKFARAGLVQFVAGLTANWRSLCVPWEFPASRVLGSDGAQGQSTASNGAKSGSIRPNRHANFGVDVATAFLIVMLGKRPPMPYVLLPQRVGPSSYPRAATDVRTTVRSARMVEVPNPAVFLG